MARLKSIGQKVGMASLSHVKPQPPAYLSNTGASVYGYRWQQARKEWLRKHPLCVKCQEERTVRVANEVDHIIPHRGDMTLFWARSNWQSLCKPHHSAKTAAGQ
jgi:5-methylcytosine-specific restriction endonuclease McrA